METKTINIGMLGCGNVGAALAQIIESDRASIAARTGIELRITKVAVRNLSKDRGVELDPSVFTTNASEVVDDPDVDIVVEVLGGIEPARELITQALNAKHPVVTANKELVAAMGAELFATAEKAGKDLLFEAAVAGGIPLIRPLRESLVGERITRVMGIVNGTTNYILSEMTTKGASYAEALADAQQLGYAERDPTADVEGYDAGAKAAIISSIAFGAGVRAGDVYHEGISEVSATDIAYAGRLGYVIKLLAICEQFDDDSVAVRVHPAMVPQEHPLASVSGSFNAVFVEGESVGDLMFYGRGAGGMPTASAVLGDVLDAAQNLTKETHASLGLFGKAQIRSIDQLDSAFYINIEVADQPGVLAAVASAFGAHGVSIRSMEQESLEERARIVFVTHSANEKSVRDTLKQITELDTVSEITAVLRVVDGDR